MTAVKLCGINHPVAFDTAVSCGADWVGFVFFPASPRYVTPKHAAELSARCVGGPPRVGLFVNPTETSIEAVLDVVALDILQIYGALDQLPAFKSRFSLPIWRAVGVEVFADLPEKMLAADRLVIEAKAPAGANRPGGNAATFDWPIVRDWSPPGPWTLAGGLTPENVASAIHQTGATAVDVSSGVEISIGRKDPARIRAFIAAAKSA